MMRENIFTEIARVVTPGRLSIPCFTSDIPEPDVSPELDPEMRPEEFFFYVQRLLFVHNRYVISTRPSSFKINDSYTGLLDLLCDAVEHGFISECEAHLLEDLILVER